MSSWFSKKPTPDEVKTWFKPYPIVDYSSVDSSIGEGTFGSPEMVKNHIESLIKEYNHKVDNWKNLFIRCLYDIGYGYTDTDIFEHEKITIQEKNYKIKGLIRYNDLRNKQELNTRNIEITDEEFIRAIKPTIKRDEQERKLNKMNKKDFVLLFAETMKSIIPKKVAQKPVGGKSKKKSRKRNASKRRNRRTHNYKNK
jgi:hypothetical protein